MTAIVVVVVTTLAVGLKSDRFKQTAVPPSVVDLSDSGIVPPPSEDGSSAEAPEADASTLPTPNGGVPPRDGSAVPPGDGGTAPPATGPADVPPADSYRSSGPPPRSPDTVKPPAATRPSSPSPARTYPPPYSFSAVAGESCNQTSASGYYRRGWFWDWYSRSWGGWSGNGCLGRMVAVPMSGSATVDDRSNVVVWWFRPAAGATCRVAVHVPYTGYWRDAAGDPATYFVYASTDASGTPIGRFTVDQLRNQGRWMAAGSYRQTTGRLSVRMVTRGIDWGTRSGAHLGASALSVSCSA